jgi:two-component system chemotaxis response regulator CheB
MRTKRIVVIGASAGGIESLRELVGTLPVDFPAAIAVVLHTSPQAPGVLHEILTRAGALQAISPRDGERLRPGHIYVAPPDFHMLIEPDRVRVARGPRENRFRPAIDPLFRSAAQVYGPAAIGVILTGNLDDGSAGLWAIKQLGGTAIVQDPEDALYPSMPLSAINNARVDYSVPLRDIGPLLVRLTQADAPIAPAHDVPESLAIEVSIAKEDDPMAAGVRRLGQPSILSCPECHGVLLELKEGNHSRFRCHTGHAYSVESLLAEINDSIERELWNAMRAMQEGSMLMRDMAGHVEAKHPATGVEKLAARARELDRHVDTLREMVGSAAEIVTTGHD